MLATNELQQKSNAELVSLIESLQEKASAHQTKIASQTKQIKSQSKIIEQILEELRLAKHNRFGRKSEKHYEDSPQRSLFDEAQEPTDKKEIEEAEESITVPSHTRKKRGRKGLPKDLPRKQIIYDLKENEKICPCGCELSYLADDKTEQLEIIPAKIYVIEHIRKKYVCKECEETFKQSPMPKLPIPKSIATPKLLSHVLVSKFQDHLPLYRQENMLKRIGVDIARETLSNWVLKCGDLLQPLVDVMQKQIQQYDIAYSDETTLQVLKEPDKPSSSKSYMWLFIGGPPDKRNYVYHYQPSRSHSVPCDFLETFTGYLHCDGYRGYDSSAKKRDVRLVACMAHARRKFFEASKASKKTGLAKTALAKIK